MPSAPGYKRDMKQERATQLARGEGVDNAIRHKARRKMVSLGMVKKGQDVDHKVPLSKGGAGTDVSNLKAKSPSANRSFPRNPDGSMKK